MLKRIYESAVREQFANERQMAFVAGPRQVGKTTLVERLVGQGGVSINWDIERDRRQILDGTAVVAERCGLRDLRDRAKKRVIGFDEIHKFARWKNFLKGFFDEFEKEASIVVTGSARLDIYKRGGDSLMGRYFLYRMHPFSVGEMMGRSYSADILRKPKRIGAEEFEALWKFGGFPEPLFQGTERFHHRWQRLRSEQLFREDLRDLTRVQEIDQMLALAQILPSRAGQLLNYSELAQQVRVSVDTVRRWLTSLESIYFSFRVRPWFRNVTKSLRKQPKIFLWDWSRVSDEGSRAENFVASHLLKAVHWWTDLGLGNFDLYFVRDTAQREVDFLVTRDGNPWFLAEVKKSVTQPISPSLDYFAGALGIKHAFQVVLDMDYVDADCFANLGSALRVPAQTLLAQLP